MKRINKIITSFFLSGIALISSGCEFTTNTKPTAPTDSSYTDIIDDKLANQTSNSYVYAPTSYVKNIQEALGAKSDILYRFDFNDNNNICRLEHNNGEPITISINPNMSEKASNIIKETTGKLFDMIQDVNDLYQYKFIDYDTNKHTNFIGDQQANITFHNSELPCNGLATSAPQAKENEDIFISNAKIEINENAINRAYQGKQAEIQLKNTILHEFMHVLGFSDVYVKEINQIDATTILYSSNFNNSNEFAKTNITPNDYKNLISTYIKPSGDINKDIERCNTLAEDYTKTYYKAWAKTNFENEELPISSLQNGTYSFVKNSQMDNGYFTTIFNLTISDNQYKLVVTNEKGEILEETNGQIKYLNLSVENSNNEEDKTPKAMAIMEGFNSKYIFKDVDRGYDYNSGFTNAIMYESNGKLVFKDALNTINKSNPKLQEKTSNNINEIDK